MKASLEETLMQARQSGIDRRREEAIEMGRFDDDGGHPKPGVVICGCGATEDAPYCYCMVDYRCRG